MSTDTEIQAIADNIDNNEPHRVFVYSENGIKIGAVARVEMPFVGEHRFKYVTEVHNPWRAADTQKSYEPIFGHTYDTAYHAVRYVWTEGHNSLRQWLDEERARSEREAEEIKAKESSLAPAEDAADLVKKFLAMAKECAEVIERFGKTL